MTTLTAGRCRRCDRHVTAAAAGLESTPLRVAHVSALHCFTLTVLAAALPIVVFAAGMTAPPAFVSFGVSSGCAYAYDMQVADITGDGLADLAVGGCQVAWVTDLR